jgi:hypothetical protein
MTEQMNATGPRGAAKDADVDVCGLAGGGEPLERHWSERQWRTRLRKAVCDLTLEKLILREAASGNF